MILAVDIGNTNIVLGCIEGRRVVRTFRTVTDRERTAGEYTGTIRDLLAETGTDLRDLEGAVLSTVVPALAEAVGGAVRALTGKEPILVSTGIRTDMPVLLDEPAELGADLICGAVAVIAEYPLPALVIDMGTATTIAVIDEGGRYLGGCIIPGMALSMRALTSGTAQLPRIPLEAPPGVIGRNTEDCMKSGAIFGTASMLDGMIDRYEEALGQKCTVVATGGLAHRVTRHCRRDIVCDEDLLLKGLAVLFEKNAG